MSYSKTLKQNRIDKLNKDWDNFAHKSLSHKDIQKFYGSKGAKVAFSVLNLQRNAIRFNKKISSPGLDTLARSSECSIRHVQYILKDLVKRGCLHFENYFKIDDNGVVVEVNHKRSTNGKLRWIINPLKKAAEYVAATISERKEIGKTFAKKEFDLYIYSWFHRQPYLESSPDEPPNKSSDQDDGPWELDL